MTEKGTVQRKSIVQRMIARFHKSARAGWLRPKRFALRFTSIPKLEKQMHWVNTRYPNLELADIMGFKRLLWLIMIIFFDIQLLTTGFSELGTLGTLLLLSWVLWYLPNLWVTQVEARQKKIYAKELPVLVDLLALNVEAGLNVQRAFLLLRDMYSGPLVDEVKQLCRQLELGRSLEEGLEEWKERIDLPSYRYVLVNILQAMRLGTPLANVLWAQSERLRHKRKQRAEELSHTATVKITVPLVLCIFPALLILYLAPVLLKFAANTV